MNGLSETDPNSFSNPNECVVNHLHLNLKVNFDRQVLEGYVEATIIRKISKATTLILDSKQLNIKNVKDKTTQENLHYLIGDPVQSFGSKLEIHLPKTNEDKFTIVIEYETSPKSEALQWLSPSQTAGKTFPYVFCQCEAIYARTMFPCQDTPSVKMPYSAVIHAPSNLTTLMSAIKEKEEISGDSLITSSTFVQKVPIPSYLIVIVVGALEKRKIGPRSHVWAEKEYVDKAAFEFSETESMLKIAEDLLGPYVWGIYDLLVLPPSFAMGGMENPCLTFLTPTLLAGDRSLANTVAHEICHSWTGNLVTNKDFQHFWLNEGFTRFVEFKICGRMNDESYRQFLALKGWKDLEYFIGIKGKDHCLTKLVVDLRGVDPEDAFSVVPYEKGHTLLFYLEQLLGGPEVFEQYLRDYNQKYKFKSLDTNEWKSHLYDYFKDKKDVLDKVDWESWLYSPGMPPVKPDYDTSLQNECVALCNAWVNTTNDYTQFSKADIERMHPQQVIQFLSLLLDEKPLSEEKMQKLTEIYGFEKNLNSEIRFKWLRLGLHARWKPIIPHVINMITEVGRIKYLVPLFRDLCNWEDTKKLATSTYKEHCHSMMHITAHAIDEVLKTAEVMT